MQTISSFLKVVDRQTIIVTLLALVATFVCIQAEFRADLPAGLIGIAIIFPIVFSINSAYRRREEALRYFASLKAHAVAIYYAHRDWAGEAPELESQARQLIEDIFLAVKVYFSSAEKDRSNTLCSVYRVFSALSKSHEDLRVAKVQANEIARVNEYLQAMIIEFERMRNILVYRTPVTLRAYSQIFLNTFPVLYAPYFAWVAADSYPVIGYGLAFLYSVVLVSLDNIQEALESPYDAIGEDDIELDVIDEIRSVV